MFVSLEQYFENIKLMYSSFPYNRVPCGLHIITTRTSPGKHNTKETTERRRVWWRKAVTCPHQAEEGKALPPSFSSGTAGKFHVPACLVLGANPQDEEGKEGEKEGKEEEEKGRKKWS